MPNWTKEQEDAIYKDGSNIIVSAGAGSGKTAVLSERVLRKLKGGVNIDELLILTFTKAAAAEMKERIRKKISKEPSLKEQLDKIDNAYITTFDSYALSVLKKYSHLLNVSKNVSIIEQSIIDLKKEEIIDDLFEELYSEENQGFLNLIDTFCTKDDSEIKRYIIDINNKLDLLYNKDSYLSEYLENYFNDSFIDEKIKEYEELLLDKLSIINGYVSELEELVDSDYFEKVNNNIGELLLSSSYEDIRNNLNTLPTLPKGSEEDVKLLKDKINSLLKELKALCIYKDKIEIKDSIYKTKDITYSIIDIITRFDARINKYKFDIDAFEFVDIAKMAIRILEENKNVRDEIRDSFNEILIDEYQDTSDLQDQFISYIENDNVYMVGDIKQSIYRFRNANPNLFKNKYNNYSINNGGIKIDLNKNFRSREEVLSDINLIFDAIMDNDIGGAEYSKTHRMIFGNTAYNNEGKMSHSNNLEVINYIFDKKGIYKKEEIEAFIICMDIKNKVENKYQVFDKDSLKIRDIKYSDIVILMDRSTNFNLYKKIFEYLNVPLTIYKDESITDSIDIGIVKNIFNLVLNKKVNQSFKYSFISILRSYLFNMEDNDIFEFFLNGNYNDSELIGLIDSIDYESLTPKELVLEIIDKFNFYEKIITVGDVKKHIVVLDYLVDLADNLTSLGYTNEDFYNYLEQIIDKKYDINFNSDKNEDGVKIMTIHKSKGLEYHICYYSGLYSKFNTSDLKESFIFDNCYGLIVPYFDNGIRNTIYKDLLKKKYLKDEISEKIRLFYVGLTRAKEKMIIVSPEIVDLDNSYDIVSNNLRLSYSSFLDIMNSVKKRISLYIKNVDLDSIGLTKDYNFVKKSNVFSSLNEIDEVIDVSELSLDNELTIDKHFSKSIHKLLSKEELSNIEFGKVFHSILENIDFENPNYDGLTKYQRNMVEKFINNAIFNGYINIYKEYEFIYTVENDEYHGIIDLLVEYDDEFKIIDYKLKDISDDAYIKQLNGYKDYIESISDKSVSIYLYSITLGTLKKL